MGCSVPPLDKMFSKKLLAISEIINNKLIERVHPCMVATTSYIANIDDVQNDNKFETERALMRKDYAKEGERLLIFITD